jgi:outer membrane protein assembly factor BamB
MATSSPSLADLNGDSVPDIVFGTGKDRLAPKDGGYVFTGIPENGGRVVAVSGATNEVLWKVPNPAEAFTTPRYLDVNRDGVQDVLMGGREGALSAYSGVDGAVLWRASPASVARTSYPYNFFTPAFIRDANGDGIADIVDVYGGDDMKLPKEPRDPSYLVILSGSDGSILAVHASPDRNEMYSSPVVYDRADGSEWVLFGTGGETHGGAAYRAPITALLDSSFTARVERLIEPGTKGVIAPATVVELTGDNEPDIVISTFDGRLIVLNGANGATIWQRQDAGEDTYHGPALARIARDGRLGFLVSRGIGSFPLHLGTVHRLFDAADGRLLYEYKDTFYPAGAPLAVDLTGDGIEELMFFSTGYPAQQGSRIHIYHAPSRKLIRHQLTDNLASTPVIADPRSTGRLELIAASWTILEGYEGPEWQRLQTHFTRFDLNAKTPAYRSWAAYMGTAQNGRYYPSESGKRD